MGYYESAADWVRFDGLVQNRVKVINDITEDRAAYSRRGTTCRVSFLGRVLAEYAAYDVAAAGRAFGVLDGVYRVLWDCRREGLAAF